MDYKQIDFNIQPLSEVAQDVLSAMLGETGFDTFEPTEKGLRAYIPAGNFSDDNLRQCLVDFFIPDTTVTYSVADVAGKDWNEEWEKNGFDPVLEREFGIRLNPRGAFGSGSHETTYQLVEYLSQQHFSGQTVLDMGCGTGVLGICMAMHGARQVVAIDIDPLSVENTQENFLLNQLSNFTVQQGDASAISGEFDTIVANIHKNIIICDLPIYKAHLRQGGTLVTSGFFTSDVSDVVSEAENHGLRLTTQLSKNDWTVLVFSLA